MKKGVTLLTVMLLIVVISILTASITLSAGVIIKEGKKNDFVTEYIAVQRDVTAYYNLNGKYPIKADVALQVTSDESKQFKDEELIGGTYKLSILDLDLLKITENKFGNEVSETDLYAVSINTGIVYYLAGFAYNNQKYYRVTEDLSADYTYDAYLNLNQIKVNEIVFMPSSVTYTNIPINVNVKVPANCTISSITTSPTVTVSSQSTNSANTIYTVNTGNVGTNYTITVKYKDENNVSKESIYIVDKYDNVVPTVTVGSITSETMTNGTTQYYLQNVKISDNLSGIDYVKYTNQIVTDVEYFKRYGEYVSSDVTILALGQLNTYTIYVVDKAGNYKLLSKQ